MLAELVTRSIELPGAPVSLLQPRGSAELPDVDAVGWAPSEPFWSVLWRSGRALAAELEQEDLSGLRVVELGCGLALPSIVAARAGADVLATDERPEALDLVRRNAAVNGVRLETATVDWLDPGDLLAEGPFDLMIGSDMLYQMPSVESLLKLLPALASELLIADPGREEAGRFFDAAGVLWSTDSWSRDGIEIRRLKLR